MSSTTAQEPASALPVTDLLPAGLLPAGLPPTSALPSGQKPWECSWLACAPGEWPTLMWVALLHVSAVIGVFFIGLPTWPIVAVAVALIFLGGLGTTVAYHRALTHRGVKLNPVVEQILIGFAVLNGSGRPRNWVAMHRLHHATSDGPDDISSPHHGGFWWAHLRWLWQAETSRGERFAPDLDGFRYRFWDYVLVPMLALSFFGGLLWPSADHEVVLAAWLWLGPLRLLWALHAQCTVNSICHLGTMSSEGGSSRNWYWLALVHMGQGENWHANHHRQQVDPRLGYGAQIDFGWMVITGLRWCGLAERVRDPRHRRSAPASTLADAA